MGRFVLFNSDWSSGQTAHGAKKKCAFAMAKTSSSTSTSYRIEKACVDPSLDKRFSFYCVNVKNKFLTLDPMQQHFPSVGSYFKIGALPPPVAQVFVRSVASKTEVKFPLFCPGLEEFAGDSPPSTFLPDNWVFGGDMARRIFEEVLEHDARGHHELMSRHVQQTRKLPIPFPTS